MVVRWRTHTLPIRSYVLVDRPPEPRCLVLGFHGYGERPAHCLEGLRGTGLEDALLVGPMGQHHFYDRGGKVVASWMTKYQREHQVQQILDFARTTVEDLRREEGPLPLYVFGFSQGASTAWRVALLGGLDPRRLFALAGDMPPEVIRALDSAPPVPATLLGGREDEVVPPATLAADEARLRAANRPVERIMVPGGHGYLPEAMAVVGRRIREDMAGLA